MGVPLDCHDICWGFPTQLMVNWWFGPGGLDFWDPGMKGIGILRGIPIRIPNHRDPNHQLTIR